MSTGSASPRSHSLVMLLSSAFSITIVRASSRRATVSTARTAADQSSPSSPWPPGAGTDTTRRSPRAAVIAAALASDGVWSTWTTAAAWPAQCASSPVRTAAATAARAGIGPEVARPTTTSAPPSRSTTAWTSSGRVAVSITG